MEKCKKIIFVSMNDTCRGPMAEVVMKMLMSGKEIEIVSRGLVVLFQEPCNPKAIAVLRGKGIILDNRVSVELSEDDITEDTLILAIGIKEKEILIEKYDPKNLYTLSEFAGVAGEMTDPYGKEIEAYKQCLDELFDRLKLAAERIKYVEEKKEDDSNRM